MTTSSSTNYNATASTIINAALRIVGAIAQGESPTASQQSEALEALNMMIKAFECDGMPLWAIKTYSLTLSAATATYTFGEGATINTPKPLKLLQAYLRNTSSSVDIPMNIVTRQEYNLLGNKSTSGLPVQVYYEPQMTTGTLYMFPVPDATIAAAYTMKLIYQRPFEDLDSTSNDFDFPSEWFDAIKYGLADRLAPEYGVPIMDRNDIARRAAQLRLEALNFGTEEGSFKFQVEKRGWW